MADCHFIAFHGWAFNHEFWKPWTDYFSQNGSFQAYDRGYFNEPRSIRLEDGDEPLIVVAHSFGLHLIDQELLERADMLIIAGGFLYFHPYAAQYKRRSRMVVQEMINELEIKPEFVLGKFFENCYSPQEAPQMDFENINLDLLVEDLKALQEAEMDPEMLKSADKVCILHGSKDRIVSYKKGRQIYNQLQEFAQYFEIKEAGHALPFTHHRQCLEFITPEIEYLK